MTNNQLPTYLLDVQSGQPIKLIQVVSIAEFDEYQWNVHISSKYFPCIFAGPQKPQKLTVLKTKHEKFGPKLKIPNQKFVPGKHRFSKLYIMQ